MEEHVITSPEKQISSNCHLDRRVKIPCITQRPPKKEKKNVRFLPPSLCRISKREGKGEEKDEVFLSISFLLLRFLFCFFNFFLVLSFYVSSIFFPFFLSFFPFLFSFLLDLIPPLLPFFPFASYSLLFWFAI